MRHDSPRFSCRPPPTGTEAAHTVKGHWFTTVNTAPSPPAARRASVATAATQLIIAERAIEKPRDAAAGKDAEGWV